MLLATCCRNKKLKKAVMVLKEFFFFNAFLGIFMGAYLRFMVSLFFSFKYVIIHDINV